MKAIRITSDFSGYPDGQTERVFVTGQEPDDLDDAYADLLVQKGLAEETKPAPAASKPAPPVPAPASPIEQPKEEATPGTVASVPFMITTAARQQLRDLGKTDDEIARMTPAEAQLALATAQKKDDAP